MATIENNKFMAKFWKQTKEIFALSIFLGGFHIGSTVICLCLLLLPRFWAFTAISVWMSQMFIPIFGDSQFAKTVSEFVWKTAPSHFPITVHLEDIAALDPERPYLVAVEPHSVLPIGLVSLTKHSGFLPWKKIKFAGSTILLWTPIVRHLWSWMGLIPASRKLFSKLLEDGTTVVVVPGGVQECLHLRPGQETIFLRNRFGFIRCAIEAGTPLVPVFCFGQSEVYHYMKPQGKWYTTLSRRLGFTPMLFWGMYGTFFPYQQPINIVVGKPLDVKKNPAPSREEVAEMLGKFITAMEGLFEKHKAEHGYKDLKLYIM
ncbi:unnamed protein product [Calypogeia fissa]